MKFTLAQFIMSYLFINPEQGFIQLTDRLSGDECEYQDHTINDVIKAIPESPTLNELKFLSVLADLQSAGVKKIKGYEEGKVCSLLVPSLDDFDVAAWAQYTSNYLKRIVHRFYPDIDGIKIERFEYNLPTEQEHDQILRDSDFGIIINLAKSFGYEHVTVVKLDLEECYSGPVVKLAFES